MEEFLEMLNDMMKELSSDEQDELLLCVKQALDIGADLDQILLR